MSMLKGTYFYHMMKTGGRSIISAFVYYLLREEIQENDDNITYTDLYRWIANRKNVKVNDAYPKKLHKELYPWQSRIRNKGFKFAFNHDFLNVRLPGHCYTITCIREPLERLLSHYRMLLELKAKNDYRETPSTDCRYIMKGIQYFIENYPKEYLLHQLYFFSKNGDVKESFSNITKCTQIILTEKMQEGFDKFYTKTNIQLQSQIVMPTELRRHGLNNQELDQVRQVLHKEYEFYYQVLKHYEQN